MSSKKEGEGSKDGSCEKNDGVAPLLSDWNVSDDDESVGEHIILPGVISTDKIVDMNSNKTSFTPKSVAVYGTQTQTRNDDEMSFSYGVPSPVFKRKKVVPSTKSAGHPGVNKKQENSFFFPDKNFAVHVFLGQTLPLPP